MMKSILSEIDAEISRLKQAKAILSSVGTIAIKRKPGRPAKADDVVILKDQKTKKRKKLSAEGRERIRQAQIKRWASVKQPTKSNAKSAAAPLSKSKKKKAAKSAA
jgi:Cu/Ag efflux pump CusA